MSQKLLRVRFISFKDPHGQSLPNTLLYVKKLTSTSTSDSEKLINFCT